MDLFPHVDIKSVVFTSRASLSSTFPCGQNLVCSPLSFPAEVSFSQTFIFCGQVSDFIMLAAVLSLLTDDAVRICECRDFPKSIARSRFDCAKSHVNSKSVIP